MTLSRASALEKETSTPQKNTPESKEDERVMMLEAELLNLKVKLAQAKREVKASKSA